jgi:hypothetical protein
MREKIIFYLFSFADESGSLPDAQEVEDVFYPLPVDINDVQQAINEVKGILKWA